MQKHCLVLISLVGLVGDTENTGLEKAGLEKRTRDQNAGVVKRSTGKRGTLKYGQRNKI